jgi:hypothetical protein
MKRILKLLLNLVMALIAVCFTLVVIFFITPSWQKSALEEVLKRDEARAWKVSEIRIQPNGLEAEDLFVLDGAVGAEVKFARMSGPVWKFPFTGLLDIRSGEITGLSLDLSKIPVGDSTGDDYRRILERVSTDPEFWEERVGLVLSKISATGIRIRIQDLQLGGKVLMPGDKVVPMRWIIKDADSNSPRLIRVEPYSGLPAAL